MQFQVKFKRHLLVFQYFYMVKVQRYGRPVLSNKKMPKMPKNNLKKKTMEVLVT